MTTLTITPVTEETEEELVQQSVARQEIIDRIKGEVCQDYDNLNNPVPFAPTVGVPVYQMV